MPDLISAAKEAFKSNNVAFILGYTKNKYDKVVPFIAKNEQDAEKLVFNHHSVYNLAVYLTRIKKPETGKIGIVAKGCDVRAIVGLMQESQIKRDDVYIIGMNCNGVVFDVDKEFGKENSQIKCKYCTDLRTPLVYDVLVGELEEFEKGEDTQLETMNMLENADAATKWEFWAAEFDKCIRCYACRQVCPMCYCEQCIVEKNRPQWIDSSPDLHGNFSWNIIRAFHMAGRCVGCHECERVCPMDIPISLLTRKMGMTAGKEFNYSHGMSPDQPTLIGNYNLSDDESFIK